MKLLSQASCLCTLTLLLGACQGGTAPALQSRLASLSFNMDSASYIARAGETLESIAFRYNTTEADLLRLNPSAVNGVHTGMELFVRQPKPNQSASSVREAAWTSRSGVDVATNATNSVRTSPTYNQNAIPLAGVASDQYLLRRDSNRLERPGVLPESPTAYREQLGFPVEEVIDDENFVIPGTVNVKGEPLNEYTSFVGGWQWPLQGQLARDYDPRRPNGRGIEIVGIPGDDVVATRNGVVNWVARSPDLVGKVVIIRHDDDYLSVYSNVEDLNVSMNDTVNQGDSIASLGANANDEPLLRFEISKDGKLLNPMDFLTSR